MNLVTPELDRGPVVTYCTFSIQSGAFAPYWAEIGNHSAGEVREKEGEKNRLFRFIRQYGLRRELPLIVATIRAFSEGKVAITPDKIVVDSRRKPVAGYDLTTEIEKVIE